MIDFPFPASRHLILSTLVLQDLYSEEGMRRYGKGGQRLALIRMCYHSYFLLFVTFVSPRFRTRQARRKHDVTRNINSEMDQSGGKRKRECPEESKQQESEGEQPSVVKKTRMSQKDAGATCTVSGVVVDSELWEHILRFFSQDPTY